MGYAAGKNPETLAAEVETMHMMPEYVVFKGNENLLAREQRLLAAFPGKRLVFEEEIKPSYLDQLLHFLNPRIHKDDVGLIYRIVN